MRSHSLFLLQVFGCYVLVHAATCCRGQDALFPPVPTAEHPIVRLAPTTMPEVAQAGSIPASQPARASACDPKCCQSNCACSSRHGDVGPIGYWKRRWRQDIKPWMHHSHWGYPEYFHAEPFGASVTASMQTHVFNGQAARLVLYQYDFHDSHDERGSHLTAYGMDHLARLLRTFSQSPLPIVIEPSGITRELDEARRANVAIRLQEMLECPIDPERVVVAKPAARGLDSTEAFEHYKNMLEHSKSEKPLEQNSGRFRPGRQ